MVDQALKELKDVENEVEKKDKQIERLWDFIDAKQLITGKFSTLHAGLHC